MEASKSKDARFANFGREPLATTGPMISIARNEIQPTVNQDGNTKSKVAILGAIGELFITRDSWFERQRPSRLSGRAPRPASFDMGRATEKPGSIIQNPFVIVQANPEASFNIESASECLAGVVLDRTGGTFSLRHS